MRSLLTSIRVHLTWALLSLGALLASCGGGDSSSSSPTTYTSVAMAGELLTYTVDPVALTYSYTITESQFNLNGKTGSGTLVRNADGSYSPSGIPNARIVILPNGLLLGAVRERFGASVVTVPIIGLSNPVSTVSALAATYNYMHRGCLAAACATDTGTFVIATNSTWSSCPGANLGAGVLCVRWPQRHAGVARQRPVAGDGRLRQRRHRARLQLGRAERAADRPEGSARRRSRRGHGGRFTAGAAHAGADRRHLDRRHVDWPLGGLHGERHGDHRDPHRRLSGKQHLR